MQNLNEILHRRLISISEISQLTRHIICERGNFPKHSYTNMEIGRSGRWAGAAVGSDRSRSTRYDGGRDLIGCAWDCCGRPVNTLRFFQILNKHSLSFQKFFIEV